MKKTVFKTAFEIDQRWLDGACRRTGHRQICQAQSLNVFLPANVHKRDLHQIHFQAWKKGIKSLYYCRSKSIQRAESSVTGHTRATSIPHLGKVSDQDTSRSCGLRGIALPVSDRLPARL